MHTEIRVFLTGALCRPDVLRLVVGEVELSSASLHDFQSDDCVPGIWYAPHSIVQGSVLQTENAQDRDRLDFYCAVYGAEPTQVTVTPANGPEIVAQAYVVAQDTARFELPDMAQPKAVYTRMAEEIMLYFNELSADYVAARMPGFFGEPHLMLPLGRCQKTRFAIYPRMSLFTSAASRI